MKYEGTWPAERIEIAQTLLRAVVIDGAVPDAELVAIKTQADLDAYVAAHPDMVIFKWSESPVDN